MAQRVPRLRHKAYVASVMGPCSEACMRPLSPPARPASAHLRRDERQTYRAVILTLTVRMQAVKVNSLGKVSCAAPFAYWAVAFTPPTSPMQSVAMACHSFSGSVRSKVPASLVQWKTALQMVGISALLVLRESQRLLGAPSATWTPLVIIEVVACMFQVPTCLRGLCTGLSLNCPQRSSIFATWLQG
jgi:hypothetical protein